MEYLSAILYSRCALLYACATILFTHKYWVCVNVYVCACTEKMHYLALRLCVRVWSGSVYSPVKCSEWNKRTWHECPRQWRCFINDIYYFPLIQDTHTQYHTMEIISAVTSFMWLNLSLNLNVQIATKACKCDKVRSKRQQIKSFTLKNAM